MVDIAHVLIFEVDADEILFWIIYPAHMSFFRDL